MKDLAQPNGDHHAVDMLHAPGTRFRYDRLAILMHWAIFLLVVVAYAAVNLRGPKGSESRDFWMGIHVWAGLLVLGLSLLRLGWRLTHGPPPVDSSSIVMTWLAKAAHIALYAFIILQPIFGVLTFNVEGNPVPLLGTGMSFSIVGANASLAPLVEDLHEAVGEIFYYVIGLHAAAALWHHYVLRDDTMRRMI